MTKVDFTIAGGTVVTGSMRGRLNVHVSDGRVTAVDNAHFDAARTIDASGMLVLPGMVDTHVHLMDPGDSTREDFPSGTSAAAAAGVTTIIEHTHSHPVRSGKDLNAKANYLRGRASVDFGLAAHVWPEDLETLHESWAAGVAFYKIFTCTTHGVPGLTASQLLSAFGSLARFGAPALVHCEDESLTHDAETTLRQDGRTDPMLLPMWRSREGEQVSVHVVGLLARITRARVTVAHASQPAIIDLVNEAQARGADIIAEACPQYLFLREDELNEHGSLRKFTPPARARTQHDLDEYWHRIRLGEVGLFSTDHAPSTAVQKRGSIWDAPFGLPGLDTTFPILADAAVRGLLSFEDLVRLYAEAPARRYGLTAKGHLAPGNDADIVLFDPSIRWFIEPSGLRTKARWSPYNGRNIRGKVVETMLRGQTIYKDGEVLRPFRGEFIPGRGRVLRP